jgi:hypothetical protein
MGVSRKGIMKYAEIELSKFGIFKSDDDDDYRAASLIKGCNPSLNARGLRRVMCLPSAARKKPKPSKRSAKFIVR